mmetsp:Transcript_1027/g.1658  ORF Transcript_1027/g.1658 Transcript_1027/m.1658 type:complete len:90 (+) Transcript_1027:2064-2333(+)
MNRPHQQSSNKNSESPSDIPQISFSLFIQRYIIKIKYRETRKNQSQEGVNIFLLAILKVHISSMHILYISQMQSFLSCDISQRQKSKSK